MLIRRSPKRARRATGKRKNAYCVTGKHLPRRGSTVGTDGARGTSRDPDDAGATARPGPCNLTPTPRPVTPGFVAVVPADAKSIATSPAPRNPRKVADGPGSPNLLVPAGVCGHQLRQGALRDRVDRWTGGRD